MSEQQCCRLCRFSVSAPILNHLFAILFLCCSCVLSEFDSISKADLSSTAGSSLASQTGLENIVGNLTDSEKEKKLYQHARMSEVLGKVTRARSVPRWIIVFFLFGLYFLILVFQGAGDADVEKTTPQGGRPPKLLLDDFYYPPQPDLPYPFCKLTKDFEVAGQGFAYLFDYSFLGTMTYETPNMTQHLLNEWFGPGVVVDNSEFVRKWRIESGTVQNPVFFKLYTTPGAPGMGVVAIRGSQIPTDSLLNMQLWLSSILTQFVRAVLPLGWVWNSIYPDLVAAVNSVQSDQLKQFAYYQVTTQFANDLLKNNYTDDGLSFDKLRFAGVSLGGGLAMISAAQSNTTAVALSGVNSVLPRMSLDPPLSLHAINTQTFNVIPDRDLVANIGDAGRLNGRIKCRAPMSSLSGCHSMWRTLCELLYSCGSAPRKPLCRCALNYGYPEPIQNGTRTFADACAEEEAKINNLGFL